MSTEPLVFDFSFDTPWVITDRLEQLVGEAKTDDQSAFEAFANAELTLLTESEEYRTAVRETYSQAGVDILSPTLGMRVDPSVEYQQRVWRDLARWNKRFERLPWLNKVTSPEQAVEVAEKGEVGIVLNIQNIGAATDGNLSTLTDFHHAGVGIMQLTYNRQNRLGSGCLDRSDGRVSRLGLEYLQKMNELGVIVDLSHCAKATTLDAIDASTHPVAFTHTACQELSDHPRCKSLEELEALAAAGGYMGVVALPSFLGADVDGKPELDTFFDHIEYAVANAGADKVGIGTDFLNVDVDFPEQLGPELKAFAARTLFDGSYGAIQNIGTGFGEFQRYTDWPILRSEIEERFPESQANGILGTNFIDFWSRVTA